uniref:Uncharacterized protein n=1 Tax=Oryza barthii TaxID=65489 RepID=A0A0D3FWW8_9ORYZ
MAPSPSSSARRRRLPPRPPFFSSAASSASASPLTRGPVTEGRWVEEEIEALWCVASRTYVRNGLLRPVPLEKAIERRVP